jgi:TonB family protein
MGIRQNIFISTIIHTMAIFSVFIAGSIVRDVADRTTENYMFVSLLKEVTDITSMASQNTKNHEDKIHPLPLPPPRGEKIKEVIYKDEGTRNDNPSHQSLRNTVTENTKVDTSIIIEQHEGISAGINISHSNTKDNGSNPPQSPFTKGGLRGIISKGGKVGLSGENTSSQNTGFSRIESSHKGNTNNPYDLIRAAIEKAKTYPFLARKKRIEGTVITGFTINSKGYPQDIKVEKSSGYEILDSAAIKIVIKAAPFPEVNGEILAPITFKLTDYISSR